MDQGTFLPKFVMHFTLTAHTALATGNQETPTHAEPQNEQYDQDHLGHGRTIHHFCWENGKWWQKEIGWDVSKGHKKGQVTMM